MFRSTSRKLHAPSLHCKDLHPWLDNVALGAPYGQSLSDTGRMHLKNVLILLTICKSWMKSWESSEVDYLPDMLRSPKDDG